MVDMEARPQSLKGSHRMTAADVPDYIKYRMRTGKCETCGSPLGLHRKCPICGIMCGPGHLSNLYPFRGHAICEHCIEKWGKVEERRGVAISFEQMERLNYQHLNA